MGASKQCTDTNRCYKYELKNLVEAESSSSSCGPPQLERSSLSTTSSSHHRDDGLDQTVASSSLSASTPRVLNEEDVLGCCVSGEDGIEQEDMRREIVVSHRTEEEVMEEKDSSSLKGGGESEGCDTSGGVIEGGERVIEGGEDAIVTEEKEAAAALNDAYNNKEKGQEEEEEESVAVSVKEEKKNMIDIAKREKSSGGGGGGGCDVSTRTFPSSLTLTQLCVLSSQRGEHAVTLIQAIIRGYLIRSAQRREKASILLQNVVRSYLARRKLLATKAAVTFQALLRGYLARRPHILHRHMYEYLQRCTRIKKQKAAIVLQRHIRGYYRRYLYQRVQTSVRRIQTETRLYMAKKSSSSSSCMRRKKYARAQTRTKEAALEGYGNNVKPRTLKRKRNSSSSSFIFTYKYAFAHCAAQRGEHAATLVQALFRGYFIRLPQRRERASIMFQSLVRGYLVRRRLLVKKAAIMFQALLRGYLSRRPHRLHRHMYQYLQRCTQIKKQKAAIVLQCHIRGYYRRYLYQRVQTSLRTIQTQIRLYLVYHVAYHPNASVQSLLLIQSSNRLKRQIQREKRQHDAAVVIQAWVRGFVTRRPQRFHKLLSNFAIERRQIRREQRRKQKQLEKQQVVISRSCDHVQCREIIRRDQNPFNVLFLSYYLMHGSNQNQRRKPSTPAEKVSAVVRRALFWNITNQRSFTNHKNKRQPKQTAATPTKNTENAGVARQRNAFRAFLDLTSPRKRNRWSRYNQKVAAEDDSDLQNQAVATEVRTPQKKENYSSNTSGHIIHTRENEHHCKKLFEHEHQCQQEQQQQRERNNSFVRFIDYCIGIKEKGNHAIPIQAMVRSYLVRQAIQGKHEAARKIQKQWYSYKRQSKSNGNNIDKRREASIISIQKFIRAYLVRSCGCHHPADSDLDISVSADFDTIADAIVDADADVNANVDATITTKKTTRRTRQQILMIISKNRRKYKLQFEKKVQAVIILQALIRGYLLRRPHNLRRIVSKNLIRRVGYDRLKTKSAAATSIQALIRGHLQRRPQKIDFISLEYMARLACSPARKVEVNSNISNDNSVASVTGTNVAAVTTANQDELQLELQQNTVEAQPNHEDAQPNHEDAQPKQEEAQLKQHAQAKQEEAQPKQEKAQAKKEEAQPKQKDPNQENAQPNQENVQPKQVDIKPNQDEAQQNGILTETDDNNDQGKTDNNQTADEDDGESGVEGIAVAAEAVKVSIKDIYRPATFQAQMRHFGFKISVSHKGSYVVGIQAIVRGYLIRLAIQRKQQAAAFIQQTWREHRQTYINGTEEAIILLANL